jgi:uncharacterized membrane protein YkoI
MLVLLLALWLYPLHDGHAQGIDSGEAASIVRSQTGGRVLSVRPASRGKASVYRVKVLLPGGRVRYYEVDRRSGRILR